LSTLIAVLKENRRSFFGAATSKIYVLYHVEPPESSAG
jgi:hypothetical protein